MNSRDSLIDNLSIMLDSGISISDVFATLGRETRSTALKKSLHKLKSKVEEGTPLWQALVQEKIYPEYTLAILRIGEQSGTLPENLKVVGIEQQKRRETQSKVRSALTYPVFIAGLLLIVGTGITW